MRLAIEQTRRRWRTQQPVTRSGARRLGLQMPRGRPRELPELSPAKRVARVAREARRDQDEVIESLRFGF
jgi:hypothetical protein